MSLLRKATAIVGAVVVMVGLLAGVASQAAAVDLIGAEVYVSSSSSGSVDGVGFASGDIMVYDGSSNTWTKFFDASDAGLGSANVDGLHIVSTEAGAAVIMLSFTGTVSVPGIGLVDDSDVVTWDEAQAAFSLSVDGSDVGLTSGGEDVDALTVSSEGYAISLLGTGSVPRFGGGTLSVPDEDLATLDSTDTFSPFLDSSDVGFTGDLVAAWVNVDSQEIFGSALNGFNIGGLTGDGDDIFVFTGTTGSTSSGTFDLFFDGDLYRFGGEQIDALHIVEGSPPPPGSADLQVAISGPTGAVVGGTIPFSVTVTNLGPDPAVNVVVTNSLSPGLSFVSTSGCAGDPNGLPCSLGDVPPSGSASFTLSAQVEPGTAGQSVTGSVEVTSSTADPSFANNTSSFPVFISGPPTAVDDGPASGSGPGDPFHTDIGTTFSLAAPGLLANDDLAAPPASIGAFGGGDLGGSVTDNPSGSSVVHRFGTLEVELDGAVEFSPDPNFAGPFTFDYRLQNTGGFSDATVTIYVGPRPVVMGGDLLYLSTAGSGTVDGLIFDDEDILVYDRGADTWSMHVDGSDVGLDTADIDGFAIEEDGSILLSLTAPRNIPGAGQTDDSDIIRFTPTILGDTTAGSFALHVDGSDLGLSSGGEDVDAVTESDDGGGLAISTFGAYNVGGGVAGGDEDLLALNLTGTGPATSGAPALLFDGSDVGLTPEDISGASRIAESDDIFLANAGVFNLPGVSGDGDDVIVFNGTTGSNTTGTFSTYFAGEDARFDGNQIDGLHVAPGAVVNDPPSLVGDNFAGPDENQTLAVDLEATDPNGDTEANGGLTYSITGGEDEGLFTINTANGVVEFLTAPDFEDPDDQDRDNTYLVELTVVDSGGLFESRVYDIEVQDVVEGASIGDFVWNDLNGNGIQEAGEPGIDGITVVLLDDNGDGLDSTTTAGGGLYGFSPGAGTYRVRFVAPGGFEFTVEAAGSDRAVDSDAAANGETSLFDLIDGETNDTIDAGLVVAPASVGDLVWLDEDRDGIRDPDEVGIAGVTVRLLDSSASPLGPVDVTDGNGVYGFVGLAPGDYRLEFVPPAGASLSPQQQGGNPAVDSDPNPFAGFTDVLTLAAGQTDLTIDAGIFFNEDPTIDTVGPLLVDENETSVADIESSDDADVEGSGLLYSLSGAGDGSFFTIDQTFGVLTFVDPPDHEDPQDSGLDNDYEVTVRVTDDDGAFDEETFTVRVEDVLEDATIGDRVWDDVNEDGIQDSGEPGIDGVTVNLLDSQNWTISTAVTADGGLYLFTVNPGTYRVEFIPPPGRDFTVQAAGSDTTVDSDADQTSGLSQFVTVVDDEDNTTIDAGLVPAAELDFGDAPAAYPVTLSVDGARHTIGGPRLGSAIDAELDGQPSGSGDGDDNTGVDDEDGIDIGGVFIPGATNPIGVTASAPGLLNAWVDWDDDGVWEADEVIATDLALTAGETFVQVTAPAGAGTGTVFARFRISTAGGLDPTGPAADGEVEDHPVVVALPPSVSIEKLVEQNGEFIDADTESDGPEATIGDDTEFQVVVTNTGSEGLTAVTLDDEALGIQAVLIPDLAPGESITLESQQLTALLAVDYCESAGALLNTAAISATGATTGLVATDTDDAWVNCVADTETSSTGSGSSFNITQPSMVLNPYIRITEVPGRETGEIRWSAANLVDGNIFVRADGRALNRNTFSELFAKIGTTYGIGDGVTTFNIPDLRGRAAVGAHTGRAAGSTTGAPTTTLSIANLPSHTHDFANGFTATAIGGDQPFSIEQPNLAIHYGILTQGIFPASLTPGQTLGEVLMTAGPPPAQNGHVPADGAALPVATNSALFSLLSVAYGGDGRTTFQLPNLDGRLTTSIGSGPSLANRTLGSERGAGEVTLTTNTMPFHVHNANGLSSTGVGNGSLFSIVQPELSMQWLIAVQGQFPISADALGGSGPSFGELALLATDSELPAGWARADGALLSIEENQALFSLLGSIYGGNAETNFGLPDLRGRTPVGSGTSSFGTFPIGQQSGAEQTALSANHLQAHTHPVVPNP